jgi:DNA-binding NtrC family response regulator
MGADTENPGTSKQRLLLVEDEPVLRDAMSRLLDREYQIDVARDADEAVGRLDEVAFDAVLADHHLPGRSGLELLELVKARFPDAVRILISGDEQVRVTAKRRARLVDGFLLKPASAREIAACVHRALARRS